VGDTGFEPVTSSV